MSTKIIFFDIDGTILSHRTHQISDSTKAAIKQVQANGHLAFVNTGRTIAEIEKSITEVGFDGYVCGCGTYISYGDTVLLQNAIPFDITQKLIEDLSNYKIEAILEGTSALYFNDQSVHPKITSLRDSQRKHNFSVKTWDDPDISVNKFCIWSPSKEILNRFYESYKEKFDFISQGKHYSEVVPKGHSKATGIEYLLHYLKLPHENTFAFGDGANDLPMLNFVKHSIAMGNSCDEIRELVSFITEDVDQDGVAYALKHYNLF